MEHALSHFHNVKTLMECTEKYELDRVTELLTEEIDPAAWQGDVEPIAQDIMFMLISFWGGMTPEARIHVREVVTNSAVEVEIANMFWKEEENG